MADMFVFGGHSSEKVIKKVFVEQIGWNSPKCVCLLNSDSFLIFSPMFFPLFNAMRDAKEQRCFFCCSPIRLVSLSVYLSLFFSLSLSHPYNKKEKHLALASFCVYVCMCFLDVCDCTRKAKQKWFHTQKKNHFTHAHFSLTHK